MYSLSQITSVADCDVLLAMVTDDKSNLEYKISGLQRQKTSYSSTSFNVAHELASLQNDLAYTDSQLASMAVDNPEREDEEIKKAKLTYQILQLNKRKKEYGNIALVNKELDLERASSQMASIDTCLNEIMARKNELGG
jgi:hypothetical protein